jgi:hypothetical protein
VTGVIPRARGALGARAARATTTGTPAKVDLPLATSRATTDDARARAQREVREGDVHRARSGRRSTADATRSDAMGERNELE